MKSRNSKETYKYGCDIGGTFTDFAVLNNLSRELKIGKCLTTPHDPSEGVVERTKLLQGVIPGFLEATESLIHGTTLIINSVIEREGAKTGLITTKGFRDIVEIRDEIRYSLYDLFIPFPKPLVPRYLRREVNERIYPDGQIFKKIDKQEVRKTLTELVNGEKIESVAVCFLHSYANPSHEKEVEKIILSEYPELVVSISSSVLPKIKEYERVSTTIVNAYVKPVMAQYISKLQEKLNSLGFRKKLFIMLSSGGISSAKTATDFPVRAIESGPAGGVLAAQYFGKLAGLDDVISFDMGGTTAKMCLIKNGSILKTSMFEVARIHRFKKGSGIPISIPSVDMLEIGAGGGSIANINKMGLLEVGPKSAGADPGPICYSRGGNNPTVTDADLVLGYLDPHYFLGGEIALDKERAKKGIEEKLSRGLGVSLEDAAGGIFNLVNENMASALRMHLAEQGATLSDVAIVAFGGAGPVHVYAMAKKLGIRRILIPMYAGVASAIGFLVAPFSFDLVHTNRISLEKAELKAIENQFKDMEKEGAEILNSVSKGKTIEYTRSVDMCYSGQGFEINVSGTIHAAEEDLKEILRDRFNKSFEALYGRTYPDVDIEIVNLRVTATVLEQPLKLMRLPTNDESVSDAMKGVRIAYSPDTQSNIEYKVYDRYKLRAGAKLTGPAIIEEKESTTIVGPDAKISIDDYGTILIEI